MYLTFSEAHLVLVEDLCATTEHFTLCFLNVYLMYTASNSQCCSCIWLFSDIYLVLVVNLYVTTEYFTPCFINMYLILTARLSVTHEVHVQVAQCKFSVAYGNCRGSWLKIIMITKWTTTENPVFRWQKSIFPSWEHIFLY